MSDTNDEILKIFLKKEEKRKELKKEKDEREEFNENSNIEEILNASTKKIKDDDISSILNGNHLEKANQYYGKDGGFNSFVERRMNEDPVLQYKLQKYKEEEKIENEKRICEEERKKQLAKHRKKRVIAGVISVATGLTLFGTGIYKEYEKKENERLKQQDAYINELIYDTDEDSFTMEDYYEFMNFYESLKTYENSVKDKSTNINYFMDSKKNMVNYVTSGKLKNAIKAFLGKTMRDAMYYGEYEQEKMNDLKNEKRVRITTKEGTAEGISERLNIYYGYNKKMTFHKKDFFIKNDVLSLPKEMSKLVSQLYELTVYNTEHKFVSEKIFLSEEKQCLMLGQKVINSMGEALSKSYLLDKNGNLVEVTKEKFDEKVYEKDKSNKVVYKNENEAER